MSLVIISAGSWLTERSIEEAMRMSPPTSVLDLFVDYLAEVNSRAELVCLSTRIANPAFVIKTFCDLRKVNGCL